MCGCAQAVAHERRAQGMREALDVQVTSSWREFQAVASVLVAAGALEAGTFRVRGLTFKRQDCCVLHAVETGLRHGDVFQSLVWLNGYCCKQATALGEVARQVSGENELWLATALTHAALQVWVCATC